MSGIAFVRRLRSKNTFEAYSSVFLRFFARMLGCLISNFISLQSVLCVVSAALYGKQLLFLVIKRINRKFSLSFVCANNIARLIAREKFHFAPYSIDCKYSL